MIQYLCYQWINTAVAMWTQLELGRIMNFRQNIIQVKNIRIKIGILIDVKFKYKYNIIKYPSPFIS